MPNKEYTLEELETMDKSTPSPKKEYSLEELNAMEPKTDNRGVIAKTLGYLDVPAGAVREGIYGELAGLKKPGDIDRLKSGQAVQSKEYLERAGVPNTALSDVFPSLYAKGAEAQEPIRLKPAKGGLLDPTLSGTLGFASDVATDPLTYLGKIAKLLKGESKTAQTASAVLNPISTAAEKTSYPVYRGGLLKADEAAVKEGAKLAPSQILFDKGVYGSTKTLRNEATKTALEDIAARDSLYQIMPAVEAGSIDYSTAKNALTPYLEHEATSSTAQKVLDQIEKMEARGASLLSPQEVSKEASVWQGMAKNAGAYGAEPSGKATSIGYDLAGGANRNRLRAVAEETIPGGGAKLDAVNERLHAILGSQKPFTQQELIEFRKGHAFPKVFDFLLPAAVGTTHGAQAGLTALAIKKLGDFTRTTPARTGLGIGLKNYGNTSVWDTILRRKLQENQ